MSQDNNLRKYGIRASGVLGLALIASLAIWTRSGPLTPTDTLAAGQAGTTETPFNATKQRQEMIKELRRLNERLTILETKLDRGVEVRVIAMPKGN